MAGGNSSNANRYKGRDIDVDGDGSVDDSDTLQGKQPNQLKTDLSQVYSNINDLASISERHDLELSINAYNYDDGFIDLFFDKSKISSSNISISTGSKGKVTLNPVFSSTTDSSISGDTETFTASQSITITEILVDQNFNNGGIVKAGIDVNGTRVSTKSKNTTAPTTFNFDVDINEGDTVTLYGDLDNSYDTFLGSYTFDSVSGFDQNGSLTHTKKDLGFTPSKIVADPDIELNNQSITMTVKDNSGNSISLNPSEFGTEQPVNFEDGNIQIKYSLSGNGNKSPEIKKTSVIGVQ